MAQILLHTLDSVDGSATFTAPNDSQTIVAGVNYPTEVPYRSDELPESTFIDVNLRPHNGVGMVKERHVESIIKRTLESLVRTEDTPRTMLQVTLQVTGVEIDENLPGGMKEGGQGEIYLPTLATALNTTILGCLDARVQMNDIAGAVLIGITQNKSLIQHPRVHERKMCKSLHVFAFKSTGDCIMMESEGSFKMEEWTRAHELAHRLVVDKTESGLLTAMRRAFEARAVNNNGTSE